MARRVQRAVCISVASQTHILHSCLGIWNTATVCFFVLSFYCVIPSTETPKWLSVLLSAWIRSVVDWHFPHAFIKNRITIKQQQQQEQKSEKERTKIQKTQTNAFTNTIAAGDNKTTKTSNWKRIFMGDNEKNEKI